MGQRAGGCDVRPSFPAPPATAPLPLAVTHYAALPLAEMLLRYYNATYPLVMNPLLRFFNFSSEQASGQRRAGWVGVGVGGRYKTSWKQ